MPTILTIFGLRVSIRTNDHGPAHVHVTGSGKEALFYLNCPNGPVSLRENFGFKRAELNKVKAELDKTVPQLCERWRAIHGDL